jgi:hypothetical protein
MKSLNRQTRWSPGEGRKVFISESKQSQICEEIESTAEAEGGKKRFSQLRKIFKRLKVLFFLPFSSFFVLREDINQREEQRAERDVKRN